VDQAVGAGVADRETPGRIHAGVEVEAQIGFRLLGALVLEVGIRCAVGVTRRPGARDESGRSVEGVLLVVAAGDLVAHGVSDTCHSDGAELGSDLAATEDQGRSCQLARRLGDQVDHAAQGVGAPDSTSRAAHHLDLLDLAQVDRHHVPHDEAEEVEVERAPVEQHQLRRLQATGATARLHVDVAGTQLGDVHAGNVAQQIAEVVGGNLLDLVGLQHADGGWDLVQRLLGAGGGDDDDLRDLFHALVLGQSEAGGEGEGQRENTDGSKQSTRSHSSSCAPAEERGAPAKGFENWANRNMVVTSQGNSEGNQCTPKVSRLKGLGAPQAR